MDPGFLDTKNGSLSVRMGSRNNIKRGLLAKKARNEKAGREGVQPIWGLKPVTLNCLLRSIKE